MSGTFAPDTARTDINFNCYNSGDGGKARVRLYNVESRKCIPITGNTRFQYCKKPGNAWFTIHSNGGYRVGQGLGVVIAGEGQAPHRRRQGVRLPPLTGTGALGGGDPLAVQHGQGPALHRC
ncbi:MULTISPECIES: hypothetical protein [unclassified Streptomyces]|uniref:Uncharacterized protein n=1 Tax=Streptomyces sp. NBC_00060 TaxID=2975636 RepID=A0AAU2HDA4_9ACTN